MLACEFGKSFDNLIIQRDGVNCAQYIAQLTELPFTVEFSGREPPNAPLAVECVRAFLATERQYWAMLGSEKHIRTILAAALQDDVARPAATALIHELGAIGYTKFRDLSQAA